MVDVESDGPIHGDFSMINIGAVFFDEHLDKIFYFGLKPIPENHIPEAFGVYPDTPERRH